MSVCLPSFVMLRSWQQHQRRRQVWIDISLPECQLLSRPGSDTSIHGYHLWHLATDHQILPIELLHYVLEKKPSRMHIAQRLRLLQQVLWFFQNLNDMPNIKSDPPWLSILRHIHEWRRSWLPVLKLSTIWTATSSSLKQEAPLSSTRK